MSSLITRRDLLSGLGLTVIAGGTAGLIFSPPFRDLVLGTGEKLSYQTHRLIGRNALAPEFTEADLSPDFRTNGNTMPASPAFQAHAASGFVNWKLQVDGLVASPQTFTLAEIKAMPARTQITRHDCVEGWSAIGQWTGVPLKAVLDKVMPTEAAQYVVFHCADQMGDGAKYYESIDFDDAYHPQTILAYGLNGKDLPIKNGAPLRVRIERQLGYKMAKYIMRIELVESLDRIGRGNGGYWEDRGYEWYAGI